MVKRIKKKTKIITREEEDKIILAKLKLLAQKRKQENKQ